MKMHIFPIHTVVNDTLQNYETRQNIVKAYLEPEAVHSTYYIFVLVQLKITRGCFSASRALNSDFGVLQSYHCNTLELVQSKHGGDFYSLYK